MTGRVCPVHGEWSTTGICRWCEPETLLDVALSGPKVRPLPVAEPTPWAKKPSGADQSTITLPLMCICQKCLRGFNTPVPLTSLECPECRAKAPTYMGVPVVIDPNSDRDGPVYVSWTFAYEDAPVAAPEGYERTEAFIDAETHAAEESRLLAQHAALRWERVARRWEAKHRRFNLKDCDIRVFEGMLIDSYLRTFYGLEPKL